MSDKVTAGEAEEYRGKVEDLIGLETEHMGGGIMAFAFQVTIEGKEWDLIIGWANGGLGYDVTNLDGESHDSGEMPKDANFTAENQAAFVRGVCAKYGVKLPEDK